MSGLLGGKDVKEVKGGNDDKVDKDDKGVKGVNDGKSNKYCGRNWEWSWKLIEWIIGWQRC